MHRRNFLKSASAISAFSLLGKAETFGKTFAPAEEIIKPKRLEVGNTIALVAPAGSINEDELKESIENIEKLGFKTVYNKNILEKHGYLAGNDERRANELNEMFGRKDVDGIICVRGGYGCARILPMLDYKTIKNNPKVLCGYSDITSLLYGIFAKTGLVAFHGPVGTSTYNDFSKRNFSDTLINPSDKQVLWNAEEINPPDNKKLYTIRSGKGNGRLAGGNLSIVVSMIGTEYDVDTTGKIVFLEEIGEEPYRIDRMLTQMIQAGKFSKASAIALGIFEKCEVKKQDPEFVTSFTLQEVLYDRLYPLGLPIVYGLSFGHVVNKFTLPFGVNAELNADNQTLTLLEPAVV
jgi:muramoyltetrapeptide carboxypeptidase